MLPEEPEMEEGDRTSCPVWLGLIPGVPERLAARVAAKSEAERACGSGDGELRRAMTGADGGDRARRSLPMVLSVRELLGLREAEAAARMASCCCWILWCWGCT